MITSDKGKPHYVAVDTTTQDIIAQGANPNTVSDTADSTGKDYILSYVPDEAQTYIF